MPQGSHLCVGLIMTVLAAPSTNGLGGKILSFAGSESVMTKKNTGRAEDQTLFLQPLLEEDAPNLTSQLLPRPNRAEAKRNDLVDKKDDVDDFVSAVTSCRDVPGLSIAVVKDGKSWTKGFGVKDVVKKTPVDASSLFGVGSLTKAFTSALLALALEEANLMGKRVSWQTKVAKILGRNFQLTRHLEEEVTLEDVLAHRTGLMAADIMAVAGFPAGMSRPRFLRRLRHLPDLLLFRSMWHYNNWIYSLAGDVTEHLLGNTWKTLLKERLLSPLGMDGALLVWDDVNVTSSKIAKPYQKTRGSLEEVDETLFEPSGSLAVSADDMAKWMTFLLNGGVLPSGDRLISKRSMKDMMTSHISIKTSFDDVVPVADRVDGYGYGWFIGSYRGKKTVCHTGGWFGYLASLTLFPDDNVAVYVSTSGPGTSAGTAAYRVIPYYLSDVALGYSPWLNQTTFGEQTTKKENELEEKSEHYKFPETNEKFVKNSQKFVGTFSNSLFGDVVIRNSAAFYGLVLKFQRLEGFLIPRAKEFEFHVLYTDKTAFYSTSNFDVHPSSLAFSRFNMSPDGKFTSLVLRAPEPQNYERLEFIRRE